MSPPRHNLCLLIDSFACGGSERQFVETVTRLDSNRYNVLVACLRRQGPFYEAVRAAGLPVREFAVRGQFSPKTFLASLRCLRTFWRGRIDLVHAFDLYSNVFAAPLARLAGVPVVITSSREHPSLGTPAKRRAMYLAFRLSHCVITNSESGRQWLLSQGFSADRLRLLRNGVDLERFGPNGHPADWRARLGLPLEALLVAVVGNLRGEKDHETLLRAVPEVVERVPTAQFLLIGSGVLERHLRSQVAGTRHGSRVFFLGFRHDVPQLLAAADLVVAPTRAESLPNAVLEAMSAGRAVVASDVDGCREVVEPERTGVLVPPGDVHALSQQIIRLLEQPSLRVAMGEAARHRVEADFDIRRAVSRLQAVYDELLDRKRRAS